MRSICFCLVLVAASGALHSSLRTHEIYEGGGPIDGIVGLYDHFKIPRTSDIPSLVAKARNGTKKGKAKAAKALKWLVDLNEDAGHVTRPDADGNKILIAAAGGIPALVSVVQDGSSCPRCLFHPLGENCGGDCQANAVGALAFLAEDNNNNKIAIAAAGGIPALVSAARNGTDYRKCGVGTCRESRGKRRAAELLSSLAAMNNDYKIAIAAAGGLPVLVAMARDGSDDFLYNDRSTKYSAVDALLELALNDDNKIAIAAAGGLPVLFALSRDYYNGNDSPGGTYTDWQNKAEQALQVLARNAENKIMIANGGFKVWNGEGSKETTSTRSERGTFALNKLTGGHHCNRPGRGKCDSMPRLDLGPASWGVGRRCVTSKVGLVVEALVVPVTILTFGALRRGSCQGHWEPYNTPAQNAWGCCDCPKGWYKPPTLKNQTKSANQDCKACPNGRFAEHTKQTECKACEAGKKTLFAPASRSHPDPQSKGAKDGQGWMYNPPLEVMNHGYRISDVSCVRNDSTPQKIMIYDEGRWGT